jgi:6-phosphogluconolactonase
MDWLVNQYHDIILEDMETKQMGKLEIRIFSDIVELSLDAGRIFVSESRNALKKKEFFTVSLSGGTTPKKLFELLASDFKEDIDWQKVHIFWGDERAGKDDPESSFQLTYQSWLGRIVEESPSFEDNIHRIKMELGLVNGAEEYAKEIEKWAVDGFDLAINGAGSDGHRNGVMPENPKIDWQNEVWDLPENVKVLGYELPPGINPYTKRITLTPWFLNRSKANILMLCGEDKAELLEKITVNKEKYSKKELPAVTFNEIQTTVLADEAAASRIRQL